MDLLKLFNELKKDKQKLILAGIIGITFVVAEVSFVIKMQLKSIGSSSQKITDLKKNIDEVKRDMSLMRKTEKEIDVEPSSKIYTEAEVPFLLQDISSIANENQIEVMQISQSKEIKKQEPVKVRKPTGKPASQTKTAAKSKPEQKAPNFISIDIKLNLYCTYHDLGAFLGQLENAEQPLFASEMRIFRDSSNYMKQNVSLTLRTYVKK